MNGSPGSRRHQLIPGTDHPRVRTRSSMAVLCATLYERKRTTNPMIELPNCSCMKTGLSEPESSRTRPYIRWRTWVAVCLRTYASWTSFNGGKLHDGKYLSENSAVAVTAPKYWHEMQSKIMQQLSNNYARWRNCKAAESSNCNRLAKCCENDRTNSVD
ncbi:hypothetical protein ALC53_11776 [Atta colombica]|uniref:Uncharacterized protein n=1 Tax=Atta colombica TaxID=520822 RepID=A0A195B0E9_9HYME|nr:hypothetical protein ALC53_11776 [Atta colombica]